MGLAPVARLGAILRAPEDDPAAPAVIDAYFAVHYALRPVDATFIGVHDHDGALPDWSPDGLARLREAGASWRDHLRASDEIPTAALRRPDWPVIDAALIRSYLEVQDVELAGTHFHRGNPSLAIGEVAFGIIGLITREFAPAHARAIELVRRLEAVDRFLVGLVASWKEARVSLPVPWVARALRECGATRWLIEHGLPCWAAACRIDQGHRDRLSTASVAALRALDAFESGLRSQPTSPTAAPVGPDVLQLLVRRGHWCPQAIDELLREARDDAALAGARLREMAGPNGLAAALDRLAAKHARPDAYFDAFHQTWRECRATTLHHELLTWPEAPLRYTAIPPWTAGAAPSLYYLYYRSPAPYDAPAIHDYVVPSIDLLDPQAQRAHLAAWNASVVKLNHVVHHGALGHHVQNAYARRAPSQVARIAATDCASRIALFQGGTMAEGWACYATDLMDEVGFLTPDEQIAEQQSRVRMAVRAVVDLGLHSGALSPDDATSLYMREAGMLPAAAQNEVTKNSMFPGTALMYWLGTRAIHQMRAEASRRAGAQSTLRTFHDRLLSFGSIPTSLLAELMRHADFAPA